MKAKKKKAQEKIGKHSSLAGEYRVMTRGTEENKGATFIDLTALPKTFSNPLVLMFYFSSPELWFSMCNFLYPISIVYRDLALF